MKWAHLSSFQENCIAAVQLTLTSGVAAVVMAVVIWGLTWKAIGMIKKLWPVSPMTHALVWFDPQQRATLSLFFKNDGCGRSGHGCGHLGSYSEGHRDYREVMAGEEQLMTHMISCSGCDSQRAISQCVTLALLWPQLPLKRHWCLVSICHPHIDMCWPLFHIFLMGHISNSRLLHTHAMLVLQVVVNIIKERKFPGKFKIMDESVLGSEEGSEPPMSCRGSQIKSKEDLAAAIGSKEGSFMSR